MADSLSGMGSFDLFPVEPEWSKRPSSGFLVSRLVEGYPGTVQALTTITDRVPQTGVLGFKLGKSDEYDLIEFFCAVKARLNRFWLKWPVKAFTLKENASSGATILHVYDNGAYRLFLGHERIYIHMTTGDLIVRHVTSITEDPDNERLILNLDAALDRDVTLANHWIIARLLLVRFDRDVLQLSYKTDGRDETSVDFVELVAEYEEV